MEGGWHDSSYKNSQGARAMKEAGAGNSACSRLTRNQKLNKINWLITAMKNETELNLAQPLLGLVEFCETYCVAGCCGINAFEIAEERVCLWIDENGVSIGENALGQLRNIMAEIAKLELDVTSDRINAHWTSQACVAWLGQWEILLDTVLNKTKQEPK
jgi:hypothetical protein